LFLSIVFLALDFSLFLLVLFFALLARFLALFDAGRRSGLGLRLLRLADLAAWLDAHGLLRLRLRLLLILLLRLNRRAIEARPLNLRLLRLRPLLHGLLLLDRRAIEARPLNL